MLHYEVMAHHVYPSRSRRTLVPHMVGMVNHSMHVKLIVELLGQNKQTIFTQLNLGMSRRPTDCSVIISIYKYLGISIFFEPNARNVRNVGKKAPTLNITHRWCSISVV